MVVERDYRDFRDDFMEVQCKQVLKVLYTWTKLLLFCLPRVGVAFKSIISWKLSIIQFEVTHKHCEYNFQAFNKDECMTLLDEEKSHITLVDAGEVFVGGRYHSLVPIMQERLTGIVALNSKYLCPLL